MTPEECYLDGLLQLAAAHLREYAQRAQDTHPYCAADCAAFAEAIEQRRNGVDDKESVNGLREAIWSLAQRIAKLEQWKFDLINN